MSNEFLRRTRKRLLGNAARLPFLVRCVMKKQLCCQEALFNNLLMQPMTACLTPNIITVTSTLTLLCARSNCVENRFLKMLSVVKDSPRGCIPAMRIIILWLLWRDSITISSKKLLLCTENSNRARDPCKGVKA